MPEDKMSIEDKKRKLRKLRSLLNTAYKISNDLIEEEEQFSKNMDSLYPIRDNIGTSKLRLDYIKY